jgi:hypothetical protein
VLVLEVVLLLVGCWGRFGIGLKVSGSMLRGETRDYQILPQFPPPACHTREQHTWRSEEPMQAMRSPCVMAPSCASRLAAVDAKRISPCVRSIDRSID